MKTQIRSFALFLLLIGLSASLIAQVSATSSASATIVTPITLAKTADLNFGNVAVSSTAGTVVLTAAGTRSSTGGVTLPATTGTVTSASFTVTGAPNYTFAITLPSTATTITSGANSMTVNSFTSNPSPTGTLNGSGTQTLKVGATLNVSASQAAGAYTSVTPFTVTVNYN
jgi:hypothetical protein